MKKVKLMFIILFIGFSIGININNAYAKEPIMEYKYTVEEEKIKRAEFIWKSCIQELRFENIITDKDIVNINKYLRDNMMSKDFFEAPMKKYDRQKKVLKVDTVNTLVKEKIITTEQGNKLIDKLSRYNLSNLDR